jgi:hypothetical protein
MSTSRQSPGPWHSLAAAKNPAQRDHRAVTAMSATGGDFFESSGTFCTAGHWRNFKVAHAARVFLFGEPN